MGYRIAVLGATGTVGRLILDILAERNFPVDSLFALDSGRLPRRQVSFGDDSILSVEPANSFDFSKVDFVFASPGAAASQIYGEKAIQAGTIYIDNSSAFRMNSAVPLIVPEVNGEALSQYKKKNLISSPNCIAIPLTIALHPLRQITPIKRVVLSTYQSISGAGQRASSELMTQTKQSLMGAPIKIEESPRQIAFNVFPHIGSFDQNGQTGEETKIIQETQKILDSKIKVAVTSVRVPTFIGHALSVAVEFEQPLTPAQARTALRQSNAVQVIDDPEEEQYITPLECVGEDAVFVSRIRKDPSSETGLLLWIVTDNLRKGAALNMIQIAEKLLSISQK